MTCSEFVERFTDFLDNEGSEDFRLAATSHVEACPACRRYGDVMTRGRELLRGLPREEVPEDFTPRLQHRLYHVDDEAALSAHTASASTALTVLAMSLFLTALAWSPALRQGAPVVELPPIVVSDPPPRLRPVSTMPIVVPALRPILSDNEAGLWDDAQSLLYEYSPLQQRYRSANPLRRAGLD
jgi:anti-sigma factor RsiW